MDDADRSLDLLRSLVARSIAQSGTMRHENRFSPAPGSRIATEAGDVGDELQGAWLHKATNAVMEMFVSTTMPLAAVDSHIKALALLSQTDIALSGETVLRAMIEAAASIWWTLDPSIDGRRRVGRHMLERARSIRAQITILRDSLRGKSDEDEKRFAEGEIERLQTRVAEIFATADEKGYPPHHDKKGRVIGFGDRRPDTTTMIERFFASGSKVEAKLGAMLYRMLSAQAHAASHGLMWSMQIGAGARVPAEVEAVKPPETTMGSLTADVARRELLLILALMTHGIVNDRVREVAGWPKLPWADWRLQVARQTVGILRARPEFR